MKTQGNEILILPDENPAETKTGIIIPKTASKLKPSGIVIGCGDGCKTAYKGARVLYSPKNGSIMDIEGKEHHVIREEQLYYVYGKETDS
jgi:co-chaperonin GroES (HSP10)